MKKVIFCLAITALCACNQKANPMEPIAGDTTEQAENKAVEDVLKNDSLKMIEKEKELLEKFK
ncbi:MAG: hypothetical protein PSX81_00035 [bacterium]|nr:hypothetical protein [bacterium]